MFRTVFDKDLYGSDRGNGMYPVSVLVIEPEVEVQEPVYVAQCKKSRTPVHPNALNVTLPKWYNCAFIKLLVSNSNLKMTTQDLYNGYLLRKVLEKYKSKDFIFASTRLDPKYYRRRRQDSPKLSQKTAEMDLYYNDNGTPTWIVNEKSRREMDGRYCDDLSEFERNNLRLSSIRDQKKVYEDTDLTPYHSPEAVSRVYAALGFVQSSAFNNDVTNDEDNPLDLSYKSHMLVWKGQKLAHCVPKIIGLVDALFPKEGESDSNGHWVDKLLAPCKVVVTKNNDFHTIKYIAERQIDRNNQGNFLLKDVYQEGAFLGFNFFWRSTRLSFRSLNNSGKFIFEFVLI